MTIILLIIAGICAWQAIEAIDTTDQAVLGGLALILTIGALA